MNDESLYFAVLHACAFSPTLFHVMLSKCQNAIPACMGHILETANSNDPQRPHKLLAALARAKKAVEESVPDKVFPQMRPTDYLRMVFSTWDMALLEDAADHSWKQVARCSGGTCDYVLGDLSSELLRIVDHKGCLKEDSESVFTLIPEKLKRDGIALGARACSLELLCASVHKLGEVCPKCKLQTLAYCNVISMDTEVSKTLLFDLLPPKSESVDGHRSDLDRPKPVRLDKTLSVYRAGGDVIIFTRRSVIFVDSKTRSLYATVSFEDGNVQRSWCPAGSCCKEANINYHQPCRQWCRERLKKWCDEPNPNWIPMLAIYEYSGRKAKGATGRTAIPSITPSSHRSHDDWSNFAKFADNELAALSSNGGGSASGHVKRIAKPPVVEILDDDDDDEVEVLESAVQQGKGKGRASEAASTGVEAMDVEEGCEATKPTVSPPLSDDNSLSPYVSLYSDPLDEKQQLIASDAKFARACQENENQTSLLDLAIAVAQEISGGGSSSSGVDVKHTSLPAGYTLACGSDSEFSGEEDLTDSSSPPTKKRCSGASASGNVVDLCADKPGRVLAAAGGGKKPAPPKKRKLRKLSDPLPRGQMKITDPPITRRSQTKESRDMAAAMEQSAEAAREDEEEQTRRLQTGVANDTAIKVISGITLTEGAVERLMDERGWLTSQIIDIRIKQLQVQYPNNYYFNTGFFSLLCPTLEPEVNIDYNRVRRWTRPDRLQQSTPPESQSSNDDAVIQKNSLFDFNRVFIPINEGSAHWVLVMVNFIGSPSISFYDSLKTEKDGSRYLDAIQQYLVCELSQKKPNSAPYLYNTVPYTPRSYPRQTNSSDCGVLMLHYMELLSEGKPIEGSGFKKLKQDEITELRRRTLEKLNV